MSPRVVGLLLVTFVVLHQGTNGQRAPPRNAFYGQQEMLDWECSQKPYQTTCPGPIARFFFNETTQRCEQVNNVCGHGGFFSLSECDNKCTCRIPSSPGTATCPGAYPQRRYFYSQFYDNCVIFDYSGCEGNGNNFMNLNECTMRCNPPREIEREHVMRSMGFQNEQMFEIQAGVHNYGPAPPPLPPPHPPKTPPPPPPRTTHAPQPPQVVHYNPGHPPPAWGHHPNQVAYPPRHWQHPPRPSYMPAPPPHPWFPPPQPTRFGPGQPGTSNMPNPSRGPMGNMRNNRNRQRSISVPGSSSFSMRNAQKEINRARQNMLQTKQQNTGRMGMNRRQRNQGRMNTNQRRNNGQNFNMGGRVTVPPTPVPSMSPTNNNNNNWGRRNQRNRGRNTAFRADPSPPADTAFSGGSLNPGAKKRQNKGNTTPSNKFNNNNAGTTDYYYYDNAGQTTTAAYYTTQTLWGAFGK